MKRRLKCIVEPRSCFQSKSTFRKSAEYMQTKSLTTLHLIQWTNDIFIAFQRQVFDLTLRGVVKHFKSFCASDKSRTAIAKDADCFRTPSASEQVTRSIDEMSAGFDFANSLSNDEQVPSICCLYRYIKPRILTRGEGLCSNSSIDKSMAKEHFFVQLFPAAFADVTDLICGEKYSTVNKCTKNYGHYQSLVTAMTADNYSYNHTFIPSLLTFVKNL